MTLTNSAMIDDVDPTAFAPASAGVQTGTITMWPTASAPTGYLLSDGSAVSRATFSDLFALIGTTFGAGDGSTTFNLPDYQARVPIGVGTGDDGINSPEAITLAQKSGTYKHKLVASEMATLTYTASLREDGDSSPLTGDAEHGTNAVLDNMDITTNAGDQPHTNTQPSLGIHFIIKT